jgi:hypothetical protein
MKSYQGVLLLKLSDLFRYYLLEQLPTPLVKQF